MLVQKPGSKVYLLSPHPVGEKISPILNKTFLSFAQGFSLGIEIGWLLALA
jgi:hypothetical protein